MENSLASIHKLFYEHGNTIHTCNKGVCMTNKVDEHSHNWRAYGQIDGTVVCDDCNVGADINDLIRQEKTALLERIYQNAKYGEDKIASEVLDRIEVALQQIKQDQTVKS